MTASRSSADTRERGRSVPPARVSPSGNEGLCPRCRHLRSCAFAGTGDDAVHSCPAFEPANDSAAGGPAAIRDVGLCVNCAWRRECRHPIPVGGVWYCEDYE